MSEIKALEAPLDEDLRGLSRYWHERGFEHRIGEQGDTQVVWTADPLSVEYLRISYQAWSRGQLEPDSGEAGVNTVTRAPLALRRLPVTLIGIALSLLGYLLVTLAGKFQVPLLQHLTFFVWSGGPREVVALPLGQPWRLLTPIFLHFTLLHIVFNMLWYWDLGARIERNHGSGRLFWVVLVTGIGSNLAQAWFTPGGLFGGMSGVIYALLGYCWVWGTLRHRIDLAVPRPVMIAMMAWLLICLVGFTELVGLGAVANAAHVGGLLLGLAIGLATALVGRR